MVHHRYSDGGTDGGTYDCRPMYDGSYFVWSFSLIVHVNINFCNFLFSDKMKILYCILYVKEPALSCAAWRLAIKGRCLISRKSVHNVEHELSVSGTCPRSLLRLCRNIPNQRRFFFPLSLWESPLPCSHLQNGSNSSVMAAVVTRDREKLIKIN